MEEGVNHRRRKPPERGQLSTSMRLVFIIHERRGMALRRLRALTSLRGSYKQEVLRSCLAGSVMTPWPASPAAGNGSPMQLPAFVSSEFKITYFSLFAGGYLKPQLFLGGNTFFHGRCRSCCSSGRGEKMKDTWSLFKRQILMLSLRSKRNSGKEGKQRGVHTPSAFEGSAITFLILALSNFFRKTEPNPFDCEANNQRAGAVCTDLQHRKDEHDSCRYTLLVPGNSLESIFGLKHTFWHLWRQNHGFAGRSCDSPSPHTVFLGQDYIKPSIYLDLTSSFSTY